MTLREQLKRERKVKAELLDALLSLDKRLRECMADPITAAEAYDTFYQDIVSDALNKAKGNI